MFDLGWSEILVIAIVMIVVVGPKDLPRVLRSFGRTTTKLRAMAGDFRRQFDDALREAELDDVKNLVDDVRKLDPRNELRKHLNPLEQAGRDIKGDLDKASREMPSPEPSKSTLAQPVEPLKTGATDMPSETASAPSAKPKAKKPAVRKAAAARKPADSKASVAVKAPEKPKKAAVASAPVEQVKAAAAKPNPAAKPKAAAKPKTAVTKKVAVAATPAKPVTAQAKPSDVAPKAATRRKKNIGSDAQ